jgi:hypothetical protein
MRKFLTTLIALTTVGLMVGCAASPEPEKTDPKPVATYTAQALCEDAEPAVNDASWSVKFAGWQQVKIGLTGDYLVGARGTDGRIWFWLKSGAGLTNVTVGQLSKTSQAVIPSLSQCISEKASEETS